MSEGKLCGHTIKIARNINQENTIEMSCDLYEGHEGNHSKMLYHNVDKEPKDIIFKDNYRLGRIEWKDKF